MYKAPTISCPNSDGRKLLEKQEQRLQTAFKAVKAAFPDTDFETFIYYWVVANTRCFHYTPPDEQPPEDKNDAMALCPFADYFNHSEDGVSRTPYLVRRRCSNCVKCEVAYDSNRYTFTATRDYGTLKSTLYPWSQEVNANTSLFKRKGRKYSQHMATTLQMSSG